MFPLQVWWAVWNLWECSLPGEEKQREKPMDSGITRAFSDSWALSCLLLLPRSGLSLQQGHIQSENTCFYPQSKKTGFYVCVCVCVSLQAAIPTLKTQLEKFWCTLLNFETIAVPNLIWEIKYSFNRNTKTISKWWSDTCKQSLPAFSPRVILLDSAFSIPHRRISLIYFLVLFAGIVLKITLASEFKLNTVKIGSNFFLNLLILPWHERPIMTKESWLCGWVGQSFMNFIAFTGSSSPSSQSILKAKKRKKSFCVGWSYTKRNSFKKAFREANYPVKLEMWCGEGNIETGGYISLSFVLFFFSVSKEGARCLFTLQPLRTKLRT